MFWAKIRNADRPYIIAVDFDGTICESRFPDIGPVRQEIVDMAKEAQDGGAKLILWTCRVGDKLEDAVNFCADNGLVFAAVNENLPESIAAFGSDCRKLYADEYWDDKAVRV